MAKKLVMFDMDGVLFNSMPRHVVAWKQAMRDYGIDEPAETFYENEGRTGQDAIEHLLRKHKVCAASDEICQRIYALKASYFDALPEAEAMPGALRALEAVRDAGVDAIVVTGSGQKRMLSRINAHFPGLLHSEWMVSALDVKYGKPKPDPYLAGLRKAGVAAEDAIVVENAPLGILSGRAAGCFVAAVNTGPLPDSLLEEAGASRLFHSMDELADALPELIGQ